MRVQFYICLLIQCCSAKLVQIFVLWRHGDRAPGELPYPKDVYNESFWPRGWDQLTEEGIRQTHSLGKWLRNRYVFENRLLSEEFSREEILFRSSNADRAIESAQGVAAGLFPTKGSKIWSSPSDPVGWQPVPIFSATYGVEDPLLRPTGVKCPMVKALIKRKTESLSVSIDSAYRDLFKLLANYTEIAKVSFKNVKSLHGIRLEMLHDLEQPSWVFDLWNGSRVIDHIHELKRINRLSNFDSREKARVRGGVLLNDMAVNLESTIRGLLTRKAFMYSSHDGTVNSLMYSLGIGNNLLIPYAAALITEVHFEENQYFVRILYKNETLQYYPLLLPGCSELCPLTAFLKGIESLRIDGLQRMKEMCRSASSALTFVRILLLALFLL